MSKIIDPNEKQNDENWFKQIKEYIDKLNMRDSDKQGSWQYIKGYGVVWVPTPGDKMGGLDKNPDSEPPQVINDLVKWGDQIDFETLGNNSVLTVKIGFDDPVYSAKLQYAIVKQVLEPRAETLKAKKTTVLFMAAADDISVISEEDMNKAGWEKKEKSRIIIPR
jgi:hypothetical protein